MEKKMKQRKENLKIKIGKISGLISLLVVLSMTTACVSSHEVKQVEGTLRAFSTAGDNNDVASLEQYLDTNYRIVMNRQFGSKDVSVMSRKLYQQKIKSKEFGGDKRSLLIENVIISGPTASAQVTFIGKKMTFVSLITLIKNAQGSWKLVSDVPVVR